MARQIIRQPNGKYAIWSTIVDNFVMIDATPQEIIDDMVERERFTIEITVKTIIEQLEKNEKPYYQSTMSWEEAVEEIKKHHGKEDETLKMIKDIQK